MHEDIDSMKLQDLFSGFGTIISCKVAVSSDGESKGFGFVQFDSEQSVKSAIESLNGTIVEGKEMCASFVFCSFISCHDFASSIVTT